MEERRIEKHLYELRYQTATGQFARLLCSAEGLGRGRA